MVDCSSISLTETFLFVTISTVDVYQASYSTDSGDSSPEVQWLGNVEICNVCIPSPQYTFKMTDILFVCMLFHNLLNTSGQ